MQKLAPLVTTQSWEETKSNLKSEQTSHDEIVA